MSQQQRHATPRGQMTRGANSGPAVMLMPPDIRSIFLPNPPLEPLPQTRPRRRHPWTGVAAYLKAFEKHPPPERILQNTPQAIAKQRKESKRQQYLETTLKPMVETYRKHQHESAGEFKGMNCYNTLFIGRLAYEVTEGKLLREMEQFGPIKDIHIIQNTNTGLSRGYAFCEYENEEDMKRAYRAADGMRLEGRFIVVDVERGHTVPDWLPRRLGGGLGGTRLTNKPVTRPGRFDPSKPDVMPVAAPGMGRGPGSMPYPPPPMLQQQQRGGGSSGPPPPSGYGRGEAFPRGDPYSGGRGRLLPPMGGPPPMGGLTPMGGPTPPPYGRHNDYPPPPRKRFRSRSPERYGGRRRM